MNRRTNEEAGDVVRIVDAPTQLVPLATVVNTDLRFMSGAGAQRCILYVRKARAVGRCTWSIGNAGRQVLLEHGGDVRREVESICAAGAGVEDESFAGGGGDGLAVGKPNTELREKFLR